MARQETGILGLESTALLHGLAVAKVPTLIQLMEPATSNIRRRQDKRVWGSRVTLEEIVAVQGVRCTSVPWTLLELGRRRAPVAARIAWESAFNKQRQAAIERLGWTFVRWGKDQLSREGALIELLREAMARAAKRPLPTIHPPQAIPDWIPEEPVLWS